MVVADDGGEDIDVRDARSARGRVLLPIREDDDDDDDDIILIITMRGRGCSAEEDDEYDEYVGTR